jgi:hypothetical protein
MTTEDFISELFYRIDEAITDVPKHRLSHLWPSEIVTLSILFALKEVGTRAFYRWLHRDWRQLFPTCLSARGCFACWLRIGPGRMNSWPPPRSWESSIAMA